MEVGTDLVGKTLDFLDERQPAEELRNHHIVSGRQVAPRGGKTDRAGKQACRVSIIAPSADQAPDAVDVQIQCKRMVVDVHLGQRGLATPRRPIEQNQPRHGAKSTATAPTGFGAAADEDGNDHAGDRGVVAGGWHHHGWLAQIPVTGPGC